MQALRYFIDKKMLAEPDENGLLGGEHSRLIDVPDLNPHDAGNVVAPLLADDEVINSWVVIDVYDDAAAEKLARGEAVSYGG